MRKQIFRLFLLAVASLAVIGCASVSIVSESETTAQETSVELTVGAAADLQFAFSDLATLFEQETGHTVTLVFGSTGQLAQQIENGAPYDLFAAANIEFIERLAEQNLVLPETIAVYARGRIVLGVNRSAGVTAETLVDLLSPEIQHIAIANPEHAPYGLAAQQALESAGVWQQIQPKLILGENIRQTLQYLQSGDAQVAIVALSIADVPEITWTLIEQNLHRPLDQGLAVVSSSQHQDVARSFAAFINGPRGRLVMQHYGFILPSETLQTPQSK